MVTSPGSRTSLQSPSSAPPTKNAATPSDSPFDAVVFSGGGCRCFWQAGFWNTAAPQIGLAPRVIGAVSAGAAFACAIVTERVEGVVEDFVRRVAANPRNFDPRKLLDGGPAFPHEAIYGGLVRDHLDEATLAQLHEGPEIRVLLSRAPRWLESSRAGALTTAAVAHVMNRRFCRVHALWGARLGFRPEVVSVRSCRTPEELATLILHTSCTPPILPLYHRDGRIVLDGGLLDNTPVDLVGEARSTLVLLTHAFAQDAIPADPGRTYVRPSAPIPIHEWDYTSPRATRQTYDLGRRDGDAFVARLRALEVRGAPGHRERKRTPRRIDEPRDAFGLQGLTGRSSSRRRAGRAFPGLREQG